MQVWILLAVIWGTTWMVIRVGVGHVPPFSFAWLRFVFALIPLVILAWLRGKKAPRNPEDLILMAITGTFFFSANYALVYWGEVRITSGLGAILFTTLPLFSLLLAHLFIASERITTRRLTGVIIGMVGVVVIFLDQLHSDHEEAVWGALAIVGASFGGAVGGLLVKKRAAHMDPLTLTTGQMIFGFLGLSILAIALEGNPINHSWNQTTLLGAAYLGIVGTSVTFVLLNWLIHNMSYSYTQLIPFASTLIAVFLGWLILNEPIHWRIITGMFFVLSGLAMTVDLLGRISAGRRKQKADIA